MICSHCYDIVGAAEGVEEDAFGVGVDCQEENAEIGVDSDQPPPPPPISFLQRLSVEMSNLHFEYPATKRLHAAGGVVDVLSGNCDP